MDNGTDVKEKLSLGASAPQEMALDALLWEGRNLTFSSTSTISGDGAKTASTPAQGIPSSIYSVGSGKRHGVSGYGLKGMYWDYQTNSFDSQGNSLEVKAYVSGDQKDSDDGNKTITDEQVAGPNHEHLGSLHSEEYYNPSTQTYTSTVRTFK